MTCPICEQQLSSHGDFLFCDTLGCEMFPGADALEVEACKMQIDHGVEPKMDSLWWLGQTYLVLTANGTTCTVASEIAQERL